MSQRATQVVPSQPSISAAGRGTVSDLSFVEGVPSASYVVRNDGKVFVLEKLGSLVEITLMAHPHMSLTEASHLNMESAYISVREAISVWGVIPHPYEVVMVDGLYRIRHKPFNSYIPGTHTDTKSIHRILEKLLLNQVVIGSGDFTYCGQSFELIESLAIESLPVRPTFNAELKSIKKNPSVSTLKYVSFSGGFEPISEITFNILQLAEHSWKDVSDNAKLYAMINSDRIWNQVPKLYLWGFNSETIQLVDTELGWLECFRELNPEFSELKDHALMSLIRSYLNECILDEHDEPARDDQFMFYVLGKILSGELTGYRAIEAGKLYGFSLSQQRPTAEALRFARQCIVYDEALESLVNRVQKVMRYIAINPSSNLLNYNTIQKGESPWEEFTLLSTIKKMLKR